MTDQIITVPTASGTEGFLGGGSLGSLLIGALLFGGGMGGFNRGGYGSGYGVGAPATSAVATEIVLNPAFQSLQNQISNLSTSIGSHEVQESVHNISDEILTASASLGTAIAAGNFTTLSSINGLGRDIVSQANSNALQQMNSFNVLNTSMFQGFNALALQNVTATNQIIQQGTALAAQLAACCCETQKAILADGNATRALINDTTVQNLRDKLSAAENQVSNNNQNQYLLSTILAHLAPHRCVS